jgi:hypothetical protein
MVELIFVEIAQPGGDPADLVAENANARVVGQIPKPWTGHRLHDHQTLPAPTGRSDSPQLPGSKARASTYGSAPAERN